MKDEYVLIRVRPNSISHKDATFLGLMEQRILFYSIFTAQDAKSVTFTKQEVEEMFGVNIGYFSDIEQHLKNLRLFGMGLVDEKSKKVHFVNAFQELYYENGVFRFLFSEPFLPQIKSQKERFLRYGLSSIQKFKCKYTIYLYDYLKDYMWGPNWKKENISIATFRQIFKLDDKTYANSNNFKKRCWGPALEEINNFTNYEIEIIQKGYGKAIRYTIIRHKDEDFKKMLDDKKEGITCHLGKILIDTGCEQCMKINKCPNALDTRPLELSYSIYKDDKKGYIHYIENEIYRNKQYNVYERVKNHVASTIEISYYHYILNQGNALNEALLKYGDVNFVPMSEEQMFDRLEFDKRKRTMDEIDRNIYNQDSSTNLEEDDDQVSFDF